MRRNLSKVRIWGVLGLLLALVLAVGYGQEVQRIPPPPPELLALKAPSVWLTTRESVKTAPFTPPNGLELYLVNLDMHAYKNLWWQATQLFTCGGSTTPGIGYFFPSAPGEWDSANIYAKITQPDVYVFGAWFTPAPATAPPGQVTDMRCAFGPANSPRNVTCGQIQIDNCSTVFWFAVQVPDSGLGCALNTRCQALWNFKVVNNSMMFVRATITKSSGGKPSPILPGRPILPPLPPPGEGVQ